MKVIEHEEDLNHFLEICKDKDVFIHPILLDDGNHVCNNSLSLLYVREMYSENEFVISVNHTDSIPLRVKNFPLQNFKRVFTFDKKILSHVANTYSKEVIEDINVEIYLKNGEIHHLPYRTNSQLFFKRFLCQNVNKYIPLMKHVEMCNKMYSSIETMKLCGVPDKTLNFYNQIILTNLAKIEKNGIKVDVNLFRRYFKNSMKHVSEKGFVYTEYNIFTSTGRPSNHHGNINFSSLNKTDGSRSVFISRFDGGFICTYDYDSYHLRLIADIIDFSLPKKNIHIYFGRQYFKCNSLSEKQYKESKKLSFQYLYGKIPENILGIPYFKAVNDFILSLWARGKTNGYVISPISGRKIYLNKISNVTPQKLFNYIVQLVETERNMIIVSDLLSFLGKFKSKLILYTYDAFVFDLSPIDGREVLVGIQKILNKDGKFPVKKMVGRNYGNMVSTSIY